MGLVILLYGVWSSMFSFAKIAMQYSPPLFLTGFRMVLAGGLLLAYLAFKRSLSFQFTRTQWLALGFLALFNIYLTNIFEFWSLQYLSAAKGCFIYSLTPFFAAIFSYLHFKEKMNAKKWIGLAIGFLGIGPVLFALSGSEELLSITSYLTWPTLAMVGAALCAEYGWVLLRLVVKDQAMSPVMANGTTMFIGGILAFGHSYFTESWNFPSANLLPLCGWTLFMALFSNILCYNLYGMMLKKYTATFLSLIGLLSPIFASLYGWIFLQETPSWTIFVSTPIVALGLCVVYYTELKQGYILKTSSRGVKAAIKPSLKSN
jgi:drug/metabolite transporter (DMT)-like permease